MESYIGDNKVILKLAGLRWVKKEDSQYSGAAQRFSLYWNYKGTDGQTTYENKDDRDIMYARVLETLTAK